MTPGHEHYELLLNLTFSTGKLNSRIKYSVGDSSAVKCSPECWSNLPTFSLAFFRASPDVGDSSPIKSLRNVDLPTPFGPKERKTH